MRSRFPSLRSFHPHKPIGSGWHMFSLDQVTLKKLIQVVEVQTLQP